MAQTTFVLRNVRSVDEHEKFGLDDHPLYGAEEGEPFRGTGLLDSFDDEPGSGTAGLVG
jgi:hypothetical protein